MYQAHLFASLQVYNSTRLIMKASQNSKIRLIIVVLAIIGRITAIEEGPFADSKDYNCSSLLSLMEKEELNIQQNNNLAALNAQLINADDLIQQLKDHGDEQVSKLFSSFKDFILAYFRTAFITSFILFAYIFITLKGKLLKEISFIKDKGEILSAIHSKVKSAAPILLTLCVLIILYSTIRAIFIVGNQPKQFSEIACLFESGPKLRFNENGAQRWLSLDEAIKIQQLKQVYQQEKPIQYALFVNYRLDMQQNLRLAQFIRKSIKDGRTEQSYLQQIDSLIKTLSSLSSIQSNKQIYHLTRFIQVYRSTHYEQSRIFSLIYTQIKDTSLFQVIFYLQQFFLVSLLITSVILGHIVFKKLSRSRIQSRQIGAARSFAFYFMAILIFYFLLLSISIVGMFWINNGLIKHAQNNDLTEMLRKAYIQDNIDKFLPGSREVRDRKSAQLYEIANKYHQLIVSIAQKQNSYYYNLFSKYIDFIDEDQRGQVQQWLQIPPIRQSKLIPHSIAARNVLHRMKSFLSPQSTLNRIEFSDFGKYLMKILLQFRKIAFTNFYTLRNHIGYIFMALLVFFIGSYIPNNTYEIDRKVRRESNEQCEKQKILQENI